MDKLTDQTPAPAALSNKQRAFIDEYLKDFNATQAALRVGYSPKTAYSQGSRLLKDVEITRAINEHLESLHMSAAESLKVLADHARGSLADFINPETNEFDFDQARKAGKMHLLKKVKRTRRYFKGSLVEESVEVEIHDPQTAAVWIGKHHRQFTNQVDLTTDGQPLPIAIVKMDIDEL